MMRTYNKAHPHPRPVISSQLSPVPISPVVLL
jgi:hypothetical protein